ncbi:MAG: hypothetical protein HRU70_01375 [Phycisphaeraceae bacterium]|nr:MAG: hypothetical protein HRU70_01375 [Phycisphaeraceae bacterium]
MRRLLWLSVLFAILACAWVMLRKPMGVPRGYAYRYGARALGLVPVAVLWPWWMMTTQHFRRSLRESGGRLCTRCAYDVSRLPLTGTCPECGGAYDVEHDRPTWVTVMSMYGLSVSPMKPTGGQPKSRS